MKNYYQILEISKNASELEIKKAFRKLAIRYHPDKNQNNPQFSQKFVEIKEAYDILLNPASRSEFDSGFFKSSNTSHPKKEPFYEANEQSENQSEAEVEVEVEKNFNYQGFESFFTEKERSRCDTPKERPIFDFWDEKISDDSEFFGYPSQIGKIVSGYSSITAKDKPKSKMQKLSIYVIGILAFMGINYLTIFIINTSLLWSVIWLLASAILIFYVVDGRSAFFHVNAYVGINGFSIFKCTENRDNVEKAFEIKFSDITDLFVHMVDHKLNFNYQNTEFLYKFMNKNKPVYELKGTFDKKQNPKEQSFDITFLRKIEQYWTIYLLDNLEKNLEERGYISFNLYPNDNNETEPYIKLGIGYITFLKKAEEFTYNFNEIQKIYSKGNILYITHKNFKKTLFFFKSGNQDEIPLLNLCNRNYFYKTMEILLGYKIN